MIRLLLVWFFLAQMCWVCFSTTPTRRLCHLESVYTFRPTAENKAALDDEFERVANYESQRALARFAALLAIDVAIIAFFWNLGMNRKLQATSPAPLSQLLLGQHPQAN